MTYYSSRPGIDVVNVWEFSPGDMAYYHITIIPYYHDTRYHNTIWLVM